tara:strand:- start:4954 stop:14103 length:9150 start_codon:yes stop_codon:yes gene_type:complete
MENYSDLLNALDSISQPNNQKNQGPNYGAYLQGQGHGSYEGLIKGDQTASDNALDFVGGALWGTVDTATMGIADYAGLDQLVMGGEAEDVFADERYSDAERQAFGGALPSTAAQYGQTIGNIAAFMLPWKYPKIPGVKTRIPVAPQAITGQLVSQPAARLTAKLLPETWFKNKVGIKGITPVQQQIKSAEIAKKAGLEGNIKAGQFNAQLSKGLFDKVRRAKTDPKISNPADFVKGASDYIEEAVKQKVNQGVLTQSQGKKMVDLWTRYYSKRPIQDFIDVFSTRFPGATGRGLGSIFHEALMFGSMDGIAERFHSWDEDRPYDWTRPKHGGELGAAFGGMKLILPKLGLGNVSSQSKGLFTKDALGRSDFRAGMSTYWRPDKFFKDKTFDQLRSMSKWFGKSNRFGTPGKYSRTVNIDGVVDDFNFSRPRMESDRWLRALNLEVNEANRMFILKEALKSEAKFLGKDIMKASLTEEWNAISFVHSAVGSAIMNWGELSNLYKSGWDATNKQDFIFNMVVGAWLNRHGYAKNKDHNESRMKRLRSGLENLGVNMRHIGEIIPSYDLNRDNFLDPLSYDVRLKRIAEKMDNMGMSVENIENISNPLPLGETSAAFSTKDLTIFKQFYRLYSVSGNKRGAARDLEGISEKDALEVQNSIVKEFGAKTVWGMGDIYVDVVNRAEKAMTDLIVNTGAEAINNIETGFDIKSANSLIPKEIDLDVQLQKSVKEGKFDDLISGGKKLSPAERVDILNDIDASLNSINEFIAQNQIISSKKRSENALLISEANFEGIYKAIKGGEKLVKETTGKLGFEFKFSDMHGMAQQINRSKAKRIVSDFMKNLERDPEVNPDWNEWEAALNTSGILSKDGINQTIVRDISTLRITDGKSLIDTKGNDSRLVEMKMFRNFVHNLLSAKGFPVADNIEIKPGKYEKEITVQKLTDLENFFNSKGMPTDARFIDTIGHEIVFDILKANVEGSNLRMDQLKFAMDFSGEIGRQTAEANVASLFEFNPIRTDKANGWIGRILETNHLSGDNLAIAQKYNEKVREISRDSKTPLAGKLVKINETNKLSFFKNDTFRTIDQMMNVAEAQGTESSRRILMDAIEAIEGTDTLKDILGAVSSKTYKDPGAVKFVSSLLSRMDILKKVNKNGEDVWVVDNKRLNNKKHRKEILKSLRNYGVHFTEIEQILGNARKFVDEQIGSQLGFYGDNSGITTDQFFKKYFNENEGFNSDMQKVLLRDNFFKTRLWELPTGDAPGKLNPNFLKEVTDALNYKEADSFNELSRVKKREVIQDIHSVASSYTQSESFKVYAFNRGTLAANTIEKSGSRNPLTDFYNELELRTEGYLDGITFDDIILEGSQFRPLQRIDIFETKANRELLDPRLDAHRNERLKKVEKELEAMDMWKFVLGNSKQVMLFNKATYSEINKAFTEMYKRVSKDLLQSDGKTIRPGYRDAYQKFENLYNKVLKSTEFDLDIHTEALRTLIFEKFLKGSQRNDFLMYLNAKPGDGVIDGVIKRFNLVWTPSAKRTSREELLNTFNFAESTGALTKADIRIVNKYLGREAGKEYNVAVINDVAPIPGEEFSGKYSQREAFEAQMKKIEEMYKKQKISTENLPSWIEYSGGRKEVSTYDSITFISKDLAKFLSLITGNKGKRIFKPIVSSYGENTYLYGKTVFVYDPNLTKLFSGKNKQVDMVMMGTADKMKSFSENYTELTPEQLLRGDKITNLLGLPIESLGMIKVPDKVTPSKLSVTILQNQMTDSEVNAVYRDYHKAELETAVDMINEVMSRPSFEAEALRLIKGMKNEDLHELISNGGAGEQLGTLMSYLEIAGPYARPGALGSDMLLNQLKKGLIDQALSPYTQKSNKYVQDNWGQKMVLSKSPYYEGKNSLDATIVSRDGQILSYGEAVPAHSAREGRIEFKDNKEIYLINKVMKNGEFEIVSAKDKISELTGAQRIEEQIYKVKVDMYEHLSLNSTDTRTNKTDRADVWVVDNLAQANEQIVEIKKGKGKGKNFAKKLEKNPDGGWILKHKYGDHKYVFIRGSEPPALIPDSKGRVKGEDYRKIKFSGEGAEVWNVMAESAQPLGALYDFISTHKDLSNYQIGMEFLRYPRTRPNDFTLLRIKEFLNKEAGNQLVLSPLDVWNIYEGDYDVDMGDAFWGTTREMLNHAVSGTQYNVTGINTDNISLPNSRLELASATPKRNRENWENYDANNRVLQRAIGAVQNLTAPLNALSNKAQVTVDGRKVLLRIPSETQGISYEVEVNFDAKDFKQHLAQNSQEIIDLLRMDSYGQVSDNVLFPPMESSITAENVKELGPVGFGSNQSQRTNTLGNNNRKPFRVFVKRKINDATGQPLSSSELNGAKNDFELELYDKLMIKAYLRHTNKLSGVMPGRQKFGAEGSKQVNYQDLITTWENYASESRNLEDAMFKAVYYHKDLNGEFVFKNNRDLLNRLFGGSRRELRTITSKNQYGTEYSYPWRRGNVIPDKVKENYINATNNGSETGSFAERSLRTIYRSPFTNTKTSIDRHLLNGEQLRRYMYVEDILLNGTEINDNAAIDNVMAALPEVIKDVKKARSNIIRLKRTAAKVAASDRSQKLKKYILDKLNNQIENYEETLRPLISKQYSKNPTIKNLPDFNLVDITTSEDILEQTSQAYSIWHLWHTSTPKSRLSAIDAKVRDIQRTYKDSYKVLFNNAGLNKLAGRRLRDSELTEHLLSPKDIETIENDIYNAMYDGYMKHGQAFLYRFVGTGFRVSKNGVGLFNERAVPLFTKPNTNFKRMIKFLVKLRNNQIEVMDHSIADVAFKKKIDDTIKEIAKQDFLWRTFFSRKAHIEDIPVKEMHMFHMARNNPEFHSSHLQMFQRYTASPIGRLYDSRTSGGMGKDYDKTMSFFRDLLTEAGLKESAEIEGSAKILSHIHELEINNMYMHPFKYLTLMQSLDPKVKSIVNEVFPGAVTPEGISPAVRNKLQYNEFFALMGGGTMNGHDGMTFNPSFGINSYSYSAIKRLISQGQSIQKANGSPTIESAKENLINREYNKEKLKSEEQKAREKCKKK